MTDIAPHGLHHVTAIASDPQANVDFYTRALGLRLVKQTVNFDAPDTYHLYYGDASGSPSTILTFFPWRGVPAGRQGSGLTTATAFSVPPESLGWWQNRIAGMGVEHEGPRTRDGEEVLTFRDPDGLVIDLVAAPGDTRSGWDGVADVPAEHAVRGLHAVTLSERLPDPTVELLTGLLGMTAAGEDGDRARFAMAGGGAGAVLDVAADGRAKGLQAGGTVHHVAFRVADRATQALWRSELVEAGLHVTEILDRQYFTSIYFHEPGGVLFEIATDEPGFAVDEPLLELGRSLKLPPWLEPTREQIAASLPPLRVPS
ncbi:ring-cleaving dioxygenase [Pseudonocardia sp. KRD-184]|uniref:Ring-cleaving dioxygenase n=1 Tax=Pseudonocardia oceani TaxID=2792013 RepID=A0ABS6UJJ1_9PSEU|nr:ring-cleaving dioxygenase [Pseudonocardia oceani]MBW0093656.1 ring-cleaving dioxygenase [Pseudonocardia oceani]MBW0098497.1 ring-cleaving dioxygenase [Pseudonocardia oceani]MBW0110985.1 ring-cleaving dioxygenase [Pseudonocardia oceani]MBW0124993.1 ring-cleaving dioxygenase [Pseudonocardia oceani]MBW0132427.1 ring-cleaving dioxygenase [Pseudonocardia oceani]